MGSRCVAQGRNEYRTCLPQRRKPKSQSGDEGPELPLGTCSVDDSTVHSSGRKAREAVKPAFHERTFAHNPYYTQTENSPQPRSFTETPTTPAMYLMFDW